MRASPRPRNPSPGDLEAGGSTALFAGVSKGAEEVRKFISKGRVNRIILVSDTLEAMTSDRPYRKGLPLEKVLEELSRFSGTQFDPVCVDAMLRLLEREGEAFLSRDRTFDIHAFLEV